MRDRLREFSLSLHPEKTRLIEFGRFALERRAHRRLGKPETEQAAADNSRSNGKPDATACGRSSRKLRSRCDSDGITQSPNRALRRQIPEVGAECPNGARSVLCGGAQ